MPNPFGAPEISVREVADKIKNGNSFVWLDVREPYEFAKASIKTATVHMTPLTQLQMKGLDALPAEAQDKDADLVVSCHHGGRSAQVTMWLKQQGWRNVRNLDGGIDAWALQIDPSVGRY